MTRNDLAIAVSQKTGDPISQVGDILQAALAISKRTLQCGKKITLRGFGAFVPASRQGGTGRDFHSGEDVIYAAQRTVKFKIGQQFKAELNEE